MQCFRCAPRLLHSTSSRAPCHPSASMLRTISSASTGQPRTSASRPSSTLASVPHWGSSLSLACSRSILRKHSTFPFPPAASPMDLLSKIFMPDDPSAIAKEEIPFFHSIANTGTLPKDDAARRPAGLVENVWNMAGQTQKYDELKQDIETEVLVVGAGMVGINIAYNLVKQGKKVVVLEGRTRGSGQSGRTSAHIMQWNDDYYSTMEEKYGTPAMKLVADSHIKAIDFIERVVQEEGIDCDFTRLEGYLFPHDEKKSTAEIIEEEYEACQKAGMTDVKTVDLSAKGDASLGILGNCILFPRTAEFHPLKYINGVAEAIVKKGGKIYEFTRVVDALDPQLEGVITTSTGHKVKATEAIIYATNSPINRNLAIHPRQEATRTYMIGMKVPKGSVARAHWWSTEEPYHYIRLQVGDHDAKANYDVLLVGGQDHSAGQHVAKYSDSWKSLEDFARPRWPQAQEVLYRWSGQVYEPIDELHMFGLDPLNPANMGQVKRYIATGDSGQGMTGSAIAAMVIGDQILGRENPWSELYSPSRVGPSLKFSSLQEFATEAGHNVRGFTEVVALRDLKDLRGLVDPRGVQDLQCGEGRVVQEGLQKVAMYKDQQGKLIKRSALCPHLGCLLEWNPMDATFDCPCHGSQFDCTGCCINGPANNDLKELF